jgi:hypothetical protein
MPYADPEKAKAAKRASYQRRLANDPKFREAEKERAARWIEENRERHNANRMACHWRKTLGMA